jgi:hypothetical protein
MRDVLFFDAMLTPKIITLVYWFALAGAVLTGLVTMFSGGFEGFLGGILIIIFGAIGARIWCELLIVMFKIHESLRTLVDRQAP